MPVSTLWPPPSAPSPRAQGTHGCGAMLLDHEGQAVLNRLAEGRWVREKPQHRPR